MLSVENLTYHYKGRPAVLKDVNFNVNTGEFLAILGNNGVGKSTMLKCFNKILTPDDGKIILDGENLLQMNARQVAQRVAFVAQNVPSTQMTVHDMVMLGRRPYMKWGFTEDDHQIVHHAMAQLRIEPLRGCFLNELSGGERQKVMLARALAQQPKLLLLDEPTSSLDIQNQYQVLQIVRDICHEQHLTAIVVIHDLNLALRFCDRFVLLRQGGVYACGGKEVLDRDALRDVYHVDAEVVAVQNQIISKLKSLAEKLRICLLLVHHTRKQQAEDRFDMISGTNGLLGCADGALILQKEFRTAKTATLDISGRDQQDQRLYLSRDEQTLAWNLERQETELWNAPPDPVLSAVASLVTSENTKWSGSSTELAAALGTELKPNALSMRLNIRAAKLEQDYHIRYESIRTHAGRQIILTYLR